MEEGPDHGLGHGAVRDHPLPEGGRTATRSPGVRPSICRAAWPTCRILPVWRSTATTDGSWRRIPRPPHGHQHRSSAQVHGDGPGKAPLSLLVHILAPLPVFVGEQSILQTKRGFPTNFGSCGSEECSLLGIALVLRGGVPYGWVPLKLPRGARPLPARPRAGARLRGLLDRRRVGPATWFPADDRRGARLSLEESRRKEHQGGERFSPPWTHPLWLVARGGFSMFRDWPAAHFFLRP